MHMSHVDAQQRVVKREIREEINKRREELRIYLIVVRRVQCIKQKHETATRDRKTCSEMRVRCWRDSDSDSEEQNVL